MMMVVITRLPVLDRVGEGAGRRSTGRMGCDGLAGVVASGGSGSVYGEAGAAAN
jgi:hypothetical protein